MNTDDIVVDILHAEYPDHCDVLGEDMLQQLMTNHKAPIKRLPGSNEMPLEKIIELAAAVIALIRELIELYLLLRSQLGRKPTTKEFVAEAAQAVGVHSPVGNSRREKIAEAVAVKMEAVA